MDSGHPTDEEKDQVKLNQQASDQPPPQTSTPPPTAVPPEPSKSPPPTPEPMPPPKPVPPPPPPPPPLPATPQKPLLEEGPQPPDVGVGKPNIGVELEGKKPEEAKIEVQTSNIDIKNYDQKPAPQPSGPTPSTEIPVSPAIQPGGAAPTKQNAPVPPIKASGGPAATIVVLALLALIFGAGGGFFGYRYWDRLKTSASTENTPTPSTETPSLDTAVWQIYTSTKDNFSIKYPNGWLASSTDPQAEKITFASNKASLEGAPTEYKVEVVFQDSQGKTLKDWVTANSVAIAETKSAKEVTVDGQTAYQQELSKNGQQIATYISRPDKVMIVTYSAASDKFGEGGDWYNKIINSIKLM